MYPKPRGSLRLTSKTVSPFTFWHHFKHILDTYFTARFKNRQSRQARHEFTENIKNMQISQKSPEVERKQKRRHQTSIENLQAAECNQLQRTPSSKIGGGGARAARRIRIRRPRVFSPGVQGVSNRTQTSADSKPLPRTPPYPPTLPVMIPFAARRIPNVG